MPRFMTDGEIKEHFGLSDRALTRLRAIKQFPPKDALIGKTDSRAVDLFFDWRIGLSNRSPIGVPFPAADGEEHFD